MRKHHPNSLAHSRAILLPHWKQTSFEYAIIKKKLKKDYDIIEYELPADILSPDPTTTPKAYRRLYNQIIKDIDGQDILLIACSISTILGYMLLHNNLIRKAIFILPGHCPAELVWEAKSTSEFKEEWENQGYTLESLSELWKEILPVNNIYDFEGKEVWLHVSEGDMELPFYKVGDLVTWLENAKAKVNVEYHPLSHAGTITRTYLYPDFLDSFLAG